MKNSSRIVRGLTMVELLVALSVMATVSIPVVAMLRAAALIDRAISSSITNQWQLEAAMHRMAQQLRLCTSFSVPSSTTPGTAYSLVTQPDSANGNASYNVSYALAANPDGSFKLNETDPRYGTNTLVNNVKSFAVSYKTASAPFVIVLTVTTSSSPPVTRTLRITPRNQ